MQAKGLVTYLKRVEMKVCILRPVIRSEDEGMHFKACYSEMIFRVFSGEELITVESFISNDLFFLTEDSPLLLSPKNICPDGSDALLDESTQQPLKCGIGYDGHSFCPIGYYCSIDSDNGNF